MTMRLVMVRNGAGVLAARKRPNFVGYGNDTRSCVLTRCGNPLAAKVRRNSGTAARMRESARPGWRSASASAKTSIAVPTVGWGDAVTPARSGSSRVVTSLLSGSGRGGRVTGCGRHCGRPCRWRCGPRLGPDARRTGVVGEVDLDRRADGLVLDLEVLRLLEVERRRDDRGGESLDARVERADIRVVEAPTRGDAVLSLRELLLQGEELLVGLELRVGLGDREQPAECRAEHTLGLTLRFRAGAG